MNTTLDGDYQTFKAESGAFVREHFFNKDPRTAAMVSNWSDDQIWNLKRGGHDYRKLFAAYTAATAKNGRPTVILAKTVKGWTLGSHFEARNSTHQMKKMTLEDIIEFRDRLEIPLPDSALDKYTPSYTSKNVVANSVDQSQVAARFLVHFHNLPMKHTNQCVVDLVSKKSQQRWHLSVC
jgi:pyruvate dehydrogenase E1 component